MLKKPLVSQLFKKFPTFYVNRSFVTEFTRSRLFLHPWPDESIPRALPSYWLKIHLNIILLFALGWSPSFRFSHQNEFILSPCILRAQPSLSPWLYHPNYIWRIVIIVTIVKLSSDKRIQTNPIYWFYMSHHQVGIGFPKTINEERLM
jgi:hypothetical protein